METYTVGYIVNRTKKKGTTNFNTRGAAFREAYILSNDDGFSNVYVRKNKRK